MQLKITTIPTNQPLQEPYFWNLGHDLQKQIT